MQKIHCEPELAAKLGSCSDSDVARRRCAQRRARRQAREHSHEPMRSRPVDEALRRGWEIVSAAKRGRCHQSTSPGRELNSRLLPKYVVANLELARLRWGPAALIDE